MANPSIQRVRVWDIPVRLFHWSLVSSFMVAYLMTQLEVGDGNVEFSKQLHQWAGYTALGLITFRLIWGFVGSPHARFTDFVPRPSHLWSYLKLFVRGEEPRHLGHNPAAAMMILFLLLMTLLIGGSGYLLTTDYGWGSDPIEEAHKWLVNITLVAVALHVTAAIYESWKHRENLIWSMITGYKKSE